MINGSQYKSALRHSYREIRKKLSDNFQVSSSTQVCLTIQNLWIYKNSNKIALYQSTKGEINLTLLWQSSCKEKKRCFFPLLSDEKKLSFISALSEEEFHSNKYGILEPHFDKTKIVSPEKLDIIFLPLVAFNKSGTRLGMGKGYYDRTLAEAKPNSLIGVAYDFQCHPCLEAESWDIPLDAIVTPNFVYWCKTF